MREKILQHYEYLKELLNKEFSLDFKGIDIFFCELDDMTGLAVSHKPFNYTIMLDDELVKLYPELMMYEVLPHEIAHILCFYFSDYQDDPIIDNDHSERWKFFAKFLGSSGSTMIVMPEYFYYLNNHGKIDTLSIKLHNKIQSSENNAKFSTCETLNTIITKFDFLGTGKIY